MRCRPRPRCRWHDGGLAPRASGALRRCVPARGGALAVAVYRLSVSVISRGGARSALASAAYRAAERLVELGRDAITSAVGAAAYRSGAELAGDGGQAFDFSRKRGVVHSEIVLPEGAPVWMGDRERLWNAVEASERRKDARLARETQLALPRELDREAQLGLVRDFVAEQMVGRGMVADFAIHDVRARDGGRQPHAHVMTTTRAIDPARPLGFGGKVRAWDDKAMLLEWREAWADHVNAALELARTPERVDHRTLEARRLEAAAAGDFDRAAELDREPEPKVGFRAWALEREGVATERGDMLRSVQERNAERRAIYAEVAEAGERAKALFLKARQLAGDAFEAFESWARTAYDKVREWIMDIADGLHELAYGGRPDEP